MLQVEQQQMRETMPGAVLGAWQSDGDAAIAGTALLDSRLRQVLLAALEGRRRKVIRELVRGRSGRILAYCLGLVSEEEFRDLDLIYRIRNYFAHHFPRPTFESQPVVERCRQLSTYRSEVGARAAFERAVWRVVARLSRPLA